MNLRQQLKSCDLFSGLDDAALQALESEVRVVEIEGQRSLFEQGDRADGMYIVLHGRLRAVRMNAEGSEQVLGEVGRGGYVGELALLLGSTRSASVRAVRDGTLLHLSDAGFRELVNRHPSAAMDVARTLARRADAAQRQVPTDAFRTIAVIPISAQARAEGVTDELIASLSLHGTTATVRMPAAGALIPAEQLTRLEQEHEQVAYVGRWAEPLWNQRCLRQADLVLLVASDDEAPCAPPEWLRGFLLPTHLVLLHSKDGLPRGTAGWLALGQYREHHHVRRSEPEDVRRLARILCGRATGLALSGGGSRTTAYIGVFKALQECGVTLDMVAGTSGGAMLGAMYALRMDPQAMLESIRRLGNAPFYLDLGPPMVSMLGGRVMNRILRSFYGDYGVEDTPITMMPVCASLGKSGPFVPARGPLWRAVQASSAVPGVFPPVAWDGDLLVDGGIVDNLPADVLLPSCSRGRILAADVSAAPRFPPSPDDLHATGGWTALWRRWTGAARPPALLDILQTSACIASNARLGSTLKNVDLHIQPLLGGVPASAEPIAAMVEAGYRETMIALERRAVTRT